MIEEADRSLHDALSVLSQTVKETRVVLGGGCAEMAMAVAVDEEAKTTEGKKALAVEAFARALRQVSRRVAVRLLVSFCSAGWADAFLAATTLRAQIPTILADNAGYDSSDLVAKLRAAHYEGRKDAGLGASGRPHGCRQRCDYSLPMRVRQLANVMNANAHRYGEGRGRLDARMRRDRVVQAQAASDPVGERGGRDDPASRRQ